MRYTRGYVKIITMSDMNQTLQEKTITRKLHAAINQALGRADYTEAVRLLGMGLAQDARREDWLELLESIVRRSQDVYALVELPERPGEEELLMLAYVQAISGHINNAMRGLFHVMTRQQHDGLHFAWLWRWLQRPGAQEQLNVDALVDELLRLLKQTPQDELEPRLHAKLAELMPTLELVLTKHPRHAKLLWMTSALARKLQRHGMAISMAERAFMLDQRWPLAMNLAYARRQAQDIDGASEAFSVARQLAPDNPSTQLEWATMLCQNGRIEQGLELIEPLLQREHEHPEAYPIWCYYQHELSQRESWYLDLELYVKQHPGALSAAQYYDRMQRERPFERFLPRPEDASIWSISQLVERLEQYAQKGLAQPPERHFTLEVDAIEAPSVGITLDLICQQYKLDGYDYRVLSSAEPDPPDPRYARRPTQLNLWRYEGLFPHVNLAPIHAPVRAAQVHALAQRPYHLASWWKMAAVIARELTPMEAFTLMPSLMCHISGPPPQELWPWQWVQRVQIAATLIIARAEQGWDGSTRRQILLDLARGPVDWSVNAALIALSQIAHEARGAQEEIAALFTELLDDLERWQWCCFGTCLCVLLLRLPGAEPESMIRAMSWLERQQQLEP